MWWYQVSQYIPHWSHLMCRGQWTSESSRQFKLLISRLVIWISLKLQCFLHYLGIWRNISCIMWLLLQQAVMLDIWERPTGMLSGMAFQQLLHSLSHKWNSVFSPLKIHFLLSPPPPQKLLCSVIALLQTSSLHCLSVNGQDLNTKGDVKRVN